MKRIFWWFAVILAIVFSAVMVAVSLFEIIKMIASPTDPDAVIGIIIRIIIIAVIATPWSIKLIRYRRAKQEAR